jgi:prefoldin subunit 5
MSKLMDASEADSDVNLVSLITDGKNPRGIPTAKFMDNVEEFLADVTPESALGALHELYGKYKFMEQSFEKTKQSYKMKIPDLMNTIEHVKMLIKKKEGGDEMYTNYNLTDTIYTRAKLDVEEGKVFLWIGANIMVEYNFNEALEMLQIQVKGTEDKLAEINEDLFALRGNSITVEVNMARIINHGVKVCQNIYECNILSM